MGDQVQNTKKKVATGSVTSDKPVIKISKKLFLSPEEIAQIDLVKIVNKTIGKHHSDENRRKAHIEQVMGFNGKNYSDYLAYNELLAKANRRETLAGTMAWLKKLDIVTMGKKTDQETGRKVDSILRLSWKEITIVAKRLSKAGLVIDQNFVKLVNTNTDSKFDQITSPVVAEGSKKLREIEDAIIDNLDAVYALDPTFEVVTKDADGKEHRQSFTLFIMTKEDVRRKIEEAKEANSYKPRRNDYNNNNNRNEKQQPVKTTQKVEKADVKGLLD